MSAARCVVCKKVEFVGSKIGGQNFLRRALRVHVTWWFHAKFEKAACYLR